MSDLEKTLEGIEGVLGEEKRKHDEHYKDRPDEFSRTHRRIYENEDSGWAVYLCEWSNMGYIQKWGHGELVRQHWFQIAGPNGYATEKIGTNANFEIGRIEETDDRIVIEVEGDYFDSWDTQFEIEGPIIRKDQELKPYNP